MKTHWKKLRDPNYLGAWDLMDENGKVTNRILKIKNVTKEKVFDGKGGSEDCTVMHFTELKPMVMNATNLKTTSKVLESDFIEDWIGKEIELTAKKVRAFGEIHDALRVENKKVKHIDPASAISKLNTAKTVDELKQAWSGLSLEEKSIPVVIETKEKRKNEIA